MLNVDTRGEGLVLLHNNHKSRRILSKLVSKFEVFWPYRIENNG